MNDTVTKSTSADTSNRGTLWLQFTGIFVAAAALGLIYNSVSPLGVRATRISESSPGPVAPSQPPKVATVRTGYFNETISLALETPAASAAPAVAANRPTSVPPTQPLPSIPKLTWMQVKGLLAEGKIVLVDARLKANYDFDHIPGAVSLPATSSAQEVQEFAKKYSPGSAFVTYCGSDTCHMSHQLAELLVRAGGCTNVSEMPGGYAEFAAARSQAPSATTPANK
jgi:rhodanese-related sulfurtransferase